MHQCDLESEFMYFAVGRTLLTIYEVVNRTVYKIEPEDVLVLVGTNTRIAMCTMLHEMSTHLN